VRTPWGNPPPNSGIPGPQGCCGPVAASCLESDPELASGPSLEKSLALACSSVKHCACLGAPGCANNKAPARRRAGQAGRETDAGTRSHECSIEST
jgi:hypothetical protein